MTRPALAEPVKILRDQDGNAADEVTLDAATTYRYRLDVTQWDRIGLGIKWTAGTATVTVYGCVDRNLVDDLGTDPASNPWLTQLAATAQFTNVPAANAGSDLLALALHALDAIVVVVDPSVNVTGWGLRALMRCGQC